MPEIISHTLSLDALISILREKFIAFTLL